LSCVGEVFIATSTQLNSTRQREQLSQISSERRNPVWAGLCSDATQLDVVYHFRVNLTSNKHHDPQMVKITRLL